MSGVDVVIAVERTDAAARSAARGRLDLAIVTEDVRDGKRVTSLACSKTSMRRDRRARSPLRITRLILPEIPPPAPAAHPGSTEDSFTIKRILRPAGVEPERIVRDADRGDRAMVKARSGISVTRPGRSSRRPRWRRASDSDYAERHPSALECRYPAAAPPSPAMEVLRTSAARGTAGAQVPAPARGDALSLTKRAKAGGSAWESNPARALLRAQRPVLKTGRATGPRSLPRARLSFETRDGRGTAWTSSAATHRVS